VKLDTIVFVLTEMTSHALMTITDLTLDTGHCTIGTLYFLY